MSSIINAGTSGLVLTGSTSTVLSLATNGTNRVNIDTSGNVGIGTTTAAAGGLLTLNRAPAAAFGTPMLQVGGASFTSGGYYSIGLGFTDATYTEPPSEIAFVTTSDSGGTLGAITFGTRSVTTNTAVTERMRIDSSGNVGIGGTANATDKVTVTGTLPVSGNVSIAFINRGTIPSGTTNTAISFGSFISTAAASFTLSQLDHFRATQGTFGAGSTVTTQYGFHVTDSLTGATNNYGFYSNIAAGSNRWNFYAAGTAKNYFAGNTGFGVDPGSSPIAAVGAAGANAVYKLFSPSGYSSFLLLGVNGGSLGEFSVDTSGNISITTNGVAANVVRVTRASSVSETMTVDAGEVRVGNNTDNGAYNLQCNGTGVWGAGAYVNGSDERLKDNIQSLDSGLDVVKAMRPVTFQYKPEYSKDQSVQPGFIAQELQTAMAGKPYLEGVVQEGPNHLNVAYQNIIPILVKAIQELEAKVAALEAR